MAAKQAILLVALALVFLLGLSAVDAGTQKAGENFDVTNESFTSDPGNWTNLSNSNIDGASYFANETVYDSAGTEMVEGTDYEWNRTDGRVKAIEGGGLDPAQSANISYHYETFSEEQQAFIAAFSGTVDVSTALLFVLSVIIIVVGLKFLTEV